MTAQEYLADVSKAIRTNFYSPDPSGGMLVAILANLVQRTVGHHHTEFGYLKFGDLLRQLEQHGLVRTGFNSKNAYSVWLNDQTIRPAQAMPGAQTEPPYRPLRKAVWLAFVATMPLGRRYLNRNTGEVKNEPADHVNEDPDWVEIMPLGSETERAIAQDFLHKNNIDNGQIEASIKEERWYIELPKLLSVRSPALAIGWKRFRSHHVIRAVKKWCELNRIDEHLVFEDIPKLSASVVQGSGDRNQLKSLLLAAIARMSTEELMKLNLLASHLVAILLPDLLG